VLRDLATVDICTRERLMWPADSSELSRPSPNPATSLGENVVQQLAWCSLKIVEHPGVPLLPHQPRDEHYSCV